MLWWGRCVAPRCVGRVIYCRTELLGIVFHEAVGGCHLECLVALPREHQKLDGPLLDNGRVSATIHNIPGVFQAGGACAK